jgi:TRAP-type C4-dicarboxylate transport system substrate-binding protein
VPSHKRKGTLMAEEMAGNSTKLMEGIIMKRTVIGCLILFLVLGLAGESKVYAASNKTFSWKYYSVVPATHPYGKILNKYFKIIEKRSNGRLKIEFACWAESPYKGFDALRVLRDGLVPTAEIIAPYVSGSAPILTGPCLPYLLPKLEGNLGTFYKLSFGMWDKPSVRKIKDKIFKNFGVVSLGTYGWGSQSYYSRLPLKKIADFKGLKIRCFDPVNTDLFKAIGAVPTVISAPEVYTALQRGVVDAVVTQAQSLLSMRWGEVMKYAYTMPTRTPVTFFGVSKVYWESLPPDLQNIMKEEVAKALKEVNDEAIVSRAKTLQILKNKYGYTITNPSESDYQHMRKICEKDVWPKWISRSGPGAREMLNACMKAIGSSQRF